MTVMTLQQRAAAIMEKHFEGFYPDVRADIEQALKEADRLAREDAANVCAALEALECGEYQRRHLSIHEIRADAFGDAERAIRASITTDEGMR